MLMKAEGAFTQKNRFNAISKREFSPFDSTPVSVQLLLVATGGVGHTCMTSIGVKQISRQMTLFFRTLAQNGSLEMELMDPTSLRNILMSTRASLVEMGQAEAESTARPQSTMCDLRAVEDAYR